MMVIAKLEKERVLFLAKGTKSKYRVGQRNVPLFFRLYLRQLLTDFQNYFTFTLRTLCNNAIIIYQTTL